MDRTVRGFVAGTVATVLAVIIHWVAYAWNLTELRWVDFAAIMTYGRSALMPVETALAYVSLFVWNGLLGTWFAFLIKVLGSKNYLFKGWLYGVSVWFMIFATTILFDIPELTVVIFRTALTNAIVSSIWGLALAEVLHRLDTRLLLSGDVD